jgi:hypothetical protein
MKAFCAAACTGLGLWCSFGSLGLAGPGPTDARLALLPSAWLLPLSIALTLAVLRIARLSDPQLSPLFASGLLLLPWLPLPPAPALLMWTGPLTVGVWIAAIGGVVLARMRRMRLSSFTDARRAPILAALLALVAYGGTACWLSPLQPGGDEPHYLIITQSLLSDGDLRIENNHRRGDYLEYFPRELKPDYLRRGQDGAIYSIHAPGLPAVLAPSFWLFGYPGAVIFLALVGALGSALTWRAGHRATGSVGAAWFGWASSVLTTPLLFVATEIFPDGLAATCVLIGMMPVFDERATVRQWLSASLALAVLPWLHTRFVLIAVTIAVCLALRGRTLRQVACLAIPLLSGGAWLSYFFSIYGTINPSAPYGGYTQMGMVNLARGLPGLLFDQQFGLIVNAPVYAVVLVGLVAAVLRLRRWGWELLGVAVPYGMAVGMYYMWWGGHSVPARFLTPLTLVCGVAAARIWHGLRVPGARALAFAALGGSLLIAAALLVPDRGRLLFNVRDGVALWLEWANRLVDLPRGLPSLFLDSPGRAWFKVGIWAASFGASWLALWGLTARDRSRPISVGGLALATTWCVAGALMLAVSLVWRAEGGQASTPETAKLSLLAHANPRLRPLAYDYAERRFESSPALLARLRVHTSTRRPNLPQQGSRLVLFNVPAGTYRPHVLASGPVSGTLVLTVGGTSRPISTWTLSGNLSGSISPSFRLPVHARTLTIEADQQAHAAISRIELEPLPEVRDPATRIAGVAIQGARYGSIAAYFLDERAYAEGEGFWIAGGAETRVAIEKGARALRLLLRNAPTENTITIEADGHRFDVDLLPREERTLLVPTKPTTTELVLGLRATGGFRPFQVEPGSTDFRYLGCWVELR